MAQFRTSRTFDVIFLLATAALLWWAIVNRVAIGDWVYFLSYQPDHTTEQVATDAGLSEYGRRLLYRANPVFGTKSQVEQACDIERLGCIDEKGRVFILTDAENSDQTVVTAAHEMLHLAYRRLSADKKAALAPLLDEGVRINATNGASDELSREQSEDDRRDEAHSYLGSEYAHLPNELETYYAQYFTDRSKVVKAEAASRTTR